MSRRDEQNWKLTDFSNTMGYPNNEAETRASSVILENRRFDHPL